jgi:hypothetical protein
VWLAARSTGDLLEAAADSWYDPSMNDNPSETDVLRAKVLQLETELRREKERAASLGAERDCLRQMIYPPLSDEVLAELLRGIREEELLGPETARREMEALLHDDEERS